MESTKWSLPTAGRNHTRDERSLLFVTPTPFLPRQSQLRLQSAYESFSNIILRHRTFQSLGYQCSDVKITFHTSVIFGFDLEI